MPVALITGASRGIGAATARLAAQRGYAVCVNYRQNRTAADAVVSATRSRAARKPSPSEPTFQSKPTS